ncbi:hypothetical protein BCR32DRAFT_296975 [Anaeromyces robustus]|uniref:Small RNA 2'-O-methyltransferase n=1 Tax=Anaeromyces robustus TaxID=1754192 RepID=A0A1Y1WPX7_9FUNG|nr:hypothetical protein BCR32DRAFT_296975 [Anaeromyces robustus]|eukprot:ORX75316.1 hypothetical protein BCR32DRAFT_296975 [Anaeromyces robustus]
MSKPFFSSPLWFERRTLILKILNKEKNIKKIIDYGCNVGNLLDVLKNGDDYEEIIGVDYDEEVLKEAYEKCEVSSYFLNYKKLHPFNIKLLKGNIKYTDKRLLNADALVCSEVIEHLDNETLEVFPNIVFNIYKPRLVIITTPNIEFNYYFKELNYGKPKQKFRHEDHNFEWTRKEFLTWVENITNQYNYEYEITGIGSAPEELINGDRGYCTQIAIFHRKDHNENININDNKAKELKENFQCLYDINYPYYENISVEILKELLIYSKNYIEQNNSKQIEQYNYYYQNNNKYNISSIATEEIINNNKNTQLTTKITENTDNIPNILNEKEKENSKNDENKERQDEKEEKEKEMEYKDENESNNINSYIYSINFDDIYNDYGIRKYCKSKEELKEYFQSKEISSIFTYDNKDNNNNEKEKEKNNKCESDNDKKENKYLDKIYIHNIDDLYDCYYKYYPKNDVDASDDYSDGYNDDYSDDYNDDYNDNYNDDYNDDYNDNYNDDYDYYYKNNKNYDDDDNNDNNFSYSCHSEMEY